MQLTYVALRLFRGDYFGGESIRRNEVGAQAWKLENEKATVRKIKGGNDEMAVYGIWRLCNIAFKCGFEPEIWMPTVLVSLYKGKGKKTEFKDYRGISVKFS